MQGRDTRSRIVSFEKGKRNGKWRGGIWKSLLFFYWCVMIYDGRGEWMGGLMD